MKRIVPIVIMAVLAALTSCRRAALQPRPAVQLVYSIAADTLGTGRLVALAGSKKAEGSIAIVGEPESTIILARRFQSVDWADNVDGNADRDSLPDFAGESFHAIMDAFNAPYTHFFQDSRSIPDSLRGMVLDSLREAAVQCAVFAWDSTCLSTPQAIDELRRKQQAKILIFTSSLQAEWGLFDVDTLRQLCGGKSIILSPVKILLDQAYNNGARNIAVWTSREVRTSGAWQNVFARSGYENASLSVITPESALDVRTQLRNFLRQYQAEGKPLDALILDSYTIDPAPLQSELKMIRRAAAEEDAAFNSMLTASFQLLDPVSSTIRTTYTLIREKRLQTHRISRPAVHYYETVESESGTPVLVETDAAYAMHTYVSNND